MTPRLCPVCAADMQHARLFLPENIDPSRLTGLSFASRKVPEFMSHRLVRCLDCDVIYADSPPDQVELAQAYHTSDFDSADEATDAADAYARAIRPSLNRLAGRGAALEIGAGTGAFLEHLATAGFARIVGIEPSRAAIAAAPASRQPWIREGIFERCQFSEGSFDLIACFMTLEHVRDPCDLTREVVRLLKPGGAFITVTHDWRAPINRILGRRSPIIDIEHMQLFSRLSIERLFAEAGLAAITSTSFVNRYALSYWMRLMPLPDGVRRLMSAGLSTSGLGGLKLGVNVGNRLCVGWRPR